MSFVVIDFLGKEFYVFMGKCCLKVLFIFDVYVFFGGGVEKVDEYVEFVYFLDFKII